jgi:8-oxo-dGTP diphosphatase
MINTRNISQFGEKPEQECKDRLGAYAVIFNEQGQLLTVKVRGWCYLPGGGVEGVEDEEIALRREVMEETGCTIEVLELIGQANEYFPGSKYGVVNKLGRFYAAKVNGEDENYKIEDDHEVSWVKVSEYFAMTNTPLFQRWAVEEMTKTQAFTNKINL